MPQEEGDLPALAPQVPEGWTSNYARLTRLDGLPTWEVGWVVTETVFAGLRQSAEADRTAAEARRDAAVTELAETRVEVEELRDYIERKFARAADSDARDETG